jgi:hypothetical protein
MARNDNYLFNNTAIALIGVLATLQRSSGMDLANSLLINPFLLHADTLKFLTAANVKLRSLEELLGKSPRTVVDFASRYQSLLPLSVNCLTIGLESELMQLDGDFLYPTDKLKSYQFPSARLLGARATRMQKAATRLAPLLQNTSASLYLNLRIEL